MRYNILNLLHDFAAKICKQMALKAFRKKLYVTTMAGLVIRHIVLVKI